MTLAPGTTVIDDPLAAARRVAALVTGADSPDSQTPPGSRGERVADAVTELKHSGLLAATVPTRLGGPQLSPSQIVEVIRILATADGSLAQIPQSHLVFSRWFFDSEHPDLEADWAEVLLSGALIANAQAEREPVHFSQDGVQDTVEGTKIFCTGSPFADIIGVTGRSSGETSQTLATFLPADAIGVSVSNDWDALGQRFTGSGRVSFRGVILPQHDKFGRLYHLDHALTLPGYGAFAQLLHIAVDVGIADGALAAGLSLANGSDPDPLTAHLAGELTALAYVGDAVLEKAARALDALWADPAADAQRRAQAASEVAAAKVTTGRTTVELASRIYELTGTRGIAEYGDEGLDRHWRDLRTHVLHERRRTKLHTLGRAALTGEDPQLGTQY